MSWVPALTLSFTLAAMGAKGDVVRSFLPSSWLPAVTSASADTSGSASAGVAETAHREGQLLRTDEWATGLRSSVPRTPIWAQILTRDTPSWQPSYKTRKALGWTLVGSGVAGGALATYFAVMAQNQAERNNADFCHHNAACFSPPSPTSANQRVDSKSVSNALGTAGVAVLATGGVLLLTTPAFSFGPRTRLGAGASSMSTGFLVITGEW